MPDKWRSLESPFWQHQCLGRHWRSHVVSPGQKKRCRKRFDYTVKNQSQIWGKNIEVLKEINTSKTNLKWNSSPPPKSVKPTVKVSVGVLQQPFPVNVQTVYVVPSITHVTLDPLHCVLLGQHTLGCCTRFNCSCHIFIVIIIIRGGGGAWWRRGRWGRGWWWRGWRGEGRPLGNRVFPGSSSPLTGREKNTNKTENCDIIIYTIKLYHLLQKMPKNFTHVLEPAYSAGKHRWLTDHQILSLKITFKC